MATHFSARGAFGGARLRKILDLSIVGLLAGLLIVPSARSVTLTGGRLVEDFSTDTYADYASSTGFWDTLNTQARAAVVAGGVASQSISFGDGSNGDLDTAGAVTFDTNSHPNGYNFRSLRLRAGAVVTVTGSSALIIRSLTTLTIDAGVTFSIKGGNGQAGTQTAAAAALAAVTGGIPLTCSASGGTGGQALTTALAGGGDGGNGKTSAGADEPFTLGAGQLQPVDGDDAVDDGVQRPDANNFFTTGFVCGSGGGGGGANGDSGLNAASGGGGGAGGGRVRLISVGAMSIQSQIIADGGDAGTGGSNGGACAGNGAGGDGGAVWFQTLDQVTVGGGMSPTVATGSGAVNACHGLAITGQPGATRADHNGAAIPLDVETTTTNAAPNQTYEVLSKSYDLNTLNAVFSGASVTSSAPGGGSASVSYAGSITGGSFSAFTSDITQLSNKNYRFVKFKVTITTAGVAAASPLVSQVAIDFKDGGLEKADLKLSPGCGTLAGLHDDDGKGPGTGGFMYAVGWLAFWLAAYRVFRFGRYGLVLKVRRL